MKTQRTAVILAGSEGLGLAAAQCLGEEGHRVVIFSRSKEKLEAARTFFIKRGHDALIFPGDLTSPDDLERLFSFVEERFGGTDILVNNTGGPKPGNILLASLVNQATNWLIAHHLPQASGSLHPNIAPYGEIFKTSDNHLITFAIGSDKQFKQLCELCELTHLSEHEKFSTNQNRVINRVELFELLKLKIETKSFETIYNYCLQDDIPIGKIRNLKEVFELPEAQNMLKHFNDNGNSKTAVQSIAFKFLD